MLKPSGRDVVLRQALECFLRFGYSRTAMQDIATAAGLSRQGLYHHFANKEALFEAMNEASNAWTLNAAREARDKARAEGRAFIDVIGATLFARLGSMQGRLGTSQEALELIDQSMRRCMPILVRYAEAFHELMTETVESEIAAGRLKLAQDVTPRDLAEAFAQMARGVNARLPVPGTDTLLATYTRGAELILRGAAA